MLKHHAIWTAIDRLADRRDISVSALAKQAGLDPTTFNKSKRAASDGRLRWPTTESIAKLLAATEMSFAQFASMVEGTDFPQSLPVVDWKEAHSPVLYDTQGYPNGPGWEIKRFPGLIAPNAFGFSLHDDRFQPLYREGDILVISPAANLRLGDRVAVLSHDDGLHIGNLKRRTALGVEILSLSVSQSAIYIAANQLYWTARITHCLFRT